MLPLLSAVLPASAQEHNASTAAPDAAQSPLILNFSKDSYSSRVGLDYSLRWDFSDLASFRPGLGVIGSGVRAITSWDITENTRVNYYGLRTNPWRMILVKEKTGSRSNGNGNAATGGLVTSGEPEYRKRLRLSVSPLVDDIRQSIDDSMRDFLLRSSLRRASPAWEKAGDTGRKAFVKDVLSLDIWGVPVPGLTEAKEGLEYISSGTYRDKKRQKTE